MSAALVWGVFAVPDDPSRSGNAPVPVPGWIRLAIEVAVLGAGVWAYAYTGHIKVGLILLALLAIHYLLSYERIIWLLGRHRY